MRKLLGIVRRAWSSLRELDDRTAVRPRVDKAVK